MTRPNFRDSTADPTKQKLQHERGVEYLMQNRPLWTYIPGINFIWQKGFVMGACTVVETGYDILEDDALRVRVYNMMMYGEGIEEL